MKHFPVKFNMNGYLIQFDPKTLKWTWSKWDYMSSPNNSQRVVKKSGNIEFMKMFPSVFTGEKESHTVGSYKEMDSALKSNGVDFIFLYLGQTTEETNYNSVEEAEKSNGVDSSPLWSLTDYWFGFDEKKKTWAMYDASSGREEFTPQSATSPLNAISPVRKTNSGVPLIPPITRSHRAEFTIH